MDLWIRNARLIGQEQALTDIGIEGGKIAMIGPGLSEGREGEAQVLDAAGGLVGPTFVEPHTHLDKALTIDRCPPNRTGLIDEVILITNEVAKTYTEEDVYERACTLLRWFLQNGVTHLRTHVDIGPIVGLKGLRGVVEAKKKFAGLIDVQIVAFAQWGVIRSPGTEQLLIQAMKEGAELVGANTVAERSNDRVKEQLEILFRIAREFDADVDMHADSTDDPNHWGLHYFAVKAVEEGWHGRVTAGHCDALAAQDPYFAARIIRDMKECGMSVVTMPIKMLYAGIYDQHPKRRGMTRMEDLKEAGINVCTGQDNVLDGFQPVFGKCDPLETAMLVAYNYSWKRREEMDYVYKMTTDFAAKAIKITDYGVAVGRPAHLNVFAAPSLLEMLRTQADRRYVLRSGKVVAETETVRRLHV